MSNDFNTKIGKWLMKHLGETNWIEKKPGHYVAIPKTKAAKFFNSTLKKAAITLGEIVLYAPGRYNTVRAAHEEVHIEQGNKYGVFFFPLYGLASLWALIRGKNYYEDNVFEKEAEEVEAEAQKARDEAIKNRQEGK